MGTKPRTRRRLSAVVAAAALAVVAVTMPALRCSPPLEHQRIAAAIGQGNGQLCPPARLRA